MAELLAFESRLYPGSSSEVGFLLEGQRLEQILKTDAATAERCGVTLYQLGCVLERMVLKYNQGEYEIDGIYRIIPGISTCGYQECPFAELDPVPIQYGRSSVRVEKIGTGESFTFESLVAHLVKDHGFCEGPSTPYRLDLERAIQFFNIQPGQDYTPQIATTSRWKSVHLRSGPDEKEKYLKLQQWSIAQFTSKYFLALVFPFELPFDIDPDSSNLEQMLIASKIRTSEFRLEMGLPAISLETIQSNVEADLVRANQRSFNFAQNINDKGLVVTIIASPTFNYPAYGMTATPLPKRSVHLQIPALNFDVQESHFQIPSTHTYRLSTQTRCF